MADYQFKRVKHQKKTVEGLYLEYSLLRTPNMISGDNIYSVRIDLTNGTKTEYKLAFDISRSLISAKKIFNTLVCNAVTPCTLFDVLEDIL
jgi:hypothetical protein